MSNEREDRIRQRAYELWQNEGSPEGREQDHWHQAAQEIEAEDSNAGAELDTKAPEHQQEASLEAESKAVDEIASDAGTKPKRKPGRPKKVESTPSADAPAKRKPGRPKKPAT